MTSPTCSPHRANAPASASMTVGRRPTGMPDPMAVHVDRLDHDAVGVEVGDVEREAHADRVDPTARLDHERTLETVPSEQARAVAHVGRRDLGRGQDPGVADQPSHGGSLPDRAAPQQPIPVRAHRGAAGADPGVPMCVRSGGRASARRGRRARSSGVRPPRVVGRVVGDGEPVERGIELDRVLDAGLGQRGVEARRRSSVNEGSSRRRRRRPDP